ncbi:exonuclease SbcCD subunit D [Radiobacillus sp. PE A8.2]|uniref:metallophosphoesterase family protein n=1 Tax=Radiobacillus sp. PE A8.2 TaxID=3380349 RepID=UPI003890A296
MSKISFIHCADLHLDSPFRGLSHITDHMFKDIRESTFASLDALVQLAVDKKVDFVLIVGDLFDSNQQSLKAYIHLQRALEKLNKHNIFVYLSYGNHDYINGQTFEADFPANVHVFSSENVTTATFTKHGNVLANIYGFSYEDRAVIENKSSEFQQTGESPFHIGMLHGSISSNTDHDIYAPFSLTDLSSSGFDYWALGHIHVREILKKEPLIVYPGNIQGRSRKESGEKGCYLVEMDEQGAELEFYPLQQIKFETISLDVSAHKSPHHLEQCLEEELKKNNDLGRLVVTLHLGSETEFLQAWHQSGELAEIIDLVNESFELDHSWIYIQDYHVINEPSWERDELVNGEHFIGELLRLVDISNTEDIEGHIEPLVRHKQARKFVEVLSDEEMTDIKYQAEQLLLHQLLGKKG